MILFSCIISSVVTEHAARTMALAEDSGDGLQSRQKEEERMLIAIANPDTVEPLVNMALMMRDPKSKKELLGVTVEVVQRLCKACEAGHTATTPQVYQVATYRQSTRGPSVY